MRRLTLLLLALSLAVVAPVAHGKPIVRSGPTANAAQAPADRDGDGVPDSSDQCPDAPGGFNGCAQPPTIGAPGNFPTPLADRDGDALPDSLDMCPDTFARSGNQGCPPPSDRDGDLLPDSSDRCPDAAGNGGALQGCPESADRDNDGVFNDNGDDACPDFYFKSANGCEPFVWRFFFSTGGIKRFLSNTMSGTTYCQGPHNMCKTVHATLTLTAATAKAAGITNRRIASISVPEPTMDIRYKVSSANRKKLARLKKITLTIRAYVTMATGKTLKPQQVTRTIYRTLGVVQQLNSLGRTNDGV